MDGETVVYSVSVNVPPEAMPQHALAIVSYFNAEGETCYGLALEGSSSLSSILGLLELVKARVLKEAEAW